MGYLEEKEVLKDYEGLASLLRETKLLFKESGRVVTMAYYPDTRQEFVLRSQTFVFHVLIYVPDRRLF